MKKFMILKSQVRISLVKIKINKTAGLNQIIIEILTVLDIFESDKYMTVAKCQKFYLHIIATETRCK